MNFTLALKNIVENTPYWAGKYLGKIPYALKLGSEYKRFKYTIQDFNHRSIESQQDYIINHLRNIVAYATENIPFYRELYKDVPTTINSISDFEKLPIISKEDVRVYFKSAKGKFQLNTGGSSGEPLCFFVDKNAWAREWAHMHYIWSTVGYSSNELMCTMLGKNIGEKIYVYNPVHNEIRLNPYINYEHNATEIIDLFQAYPIRYFQGYPSNTYKFFKELENKISSEQKSFISKQIKACFLSSEYPLPYMIDYLTNNWGLQLISWYGHSEMCVLAYQHNIQQEDYFPMQTYGYAEVHDNILIGTSFHNYDMPLIRYSTGDVVLPSKNKSGLLTSFKVSEGRNGDFITDLNGNSISIVSLIFGRHHKAFNFTDYIQIHQDQTKKVTIYMTLVDQRAKPKGFDFSKSFDFSGINIDFDYKTISKPIRTIGGKLKLKLTDKDILDNGI